MHSKSKSTSQSAIRVKNALLAAPAAGALHAAAAHSTTFQPHSVCLTDAPVFLAEDRCRARFLVEFGVFKNICSDAASSSFVAVERLQLLFSQVSSLLHLAFSHQKRLVASLFEYIQTFDCESPSNVSINSALLSQPVVNKAKSKSGAHKTQKAAGQDSVLPLRRMMALGDLLSLCASSTTSFFSSFLF
jgi:hypothetical protein